jgi:signal peptide peptidase SppA
MTPPVLTVPAECVARYARIEDYVGAWAMEPRAFDSMWRYIAAVNLPAHMAAGPPPKPPTLTDMVPVKGGQNVAVVKLSGTLMKGQSSFGGTSTVQARRELRQAAADDSVSGILLAIDSPGGTVSGTHALAADVRAIQRKKAVWAYADDTTASAAYWIGSQAGMFYAGSPTTLVGSIGTILTVQDSSAAAERMGVKTHILATGDVKGAGTPGTEVTPAHLSYFQSVVNGLQQHFDADVRRSRGMTAAQLQEVRTGGVWPASEAVGLKLVDGIKSMDAVIEALASAK